jgi:hypothetical protein
LSLFGGVGRAADRDQQSTPSGAQVSLNMGVASAGNQTADEVYVSARTSEIPKTNPCIGSIDKGKRANKINSVLIG